MIYYKYYKPRKESVQLHRFLSFAILNDRVQKYIRYFTEKKEKETRYELYCF